MQKSAATDIKTNPEEEAAGYSRVLMRVSPSEGEAPVEIMIEAQYQQAGISSVPAFVINQRYLISGAQDPATLAASLLQIADEMTTE